MKRSIVLALVALAAAVAIAATQLTALQGTAPGERPARDVVAAPEFTGIERWLNSEPLTMAGLRGKVVWVDFWTYSCINCIRTLPSIRDFYARYRPFGLEIVGVHSPEFAFERSPARVSEAIARHEVPYPVALDNEMATWRAYRNQYWPRVYLVDAQGRIRFDHIGEGGEGRIQRELRALLGETGASLPAPIDFSVEAHNPHITPEVYAGYERGGAQGALASPEGYRPGRVTRYAPVRAADLDAAGARGAFFLEGAWRAEREFVEAAEEGARVVLPFFARDVFFVASADGAPSVRVLLDGAPVATTAAGADVRDGAVRVARADLYRVVRLPDTDRGLLTLEAARGFRLYTFTFG